MSAYVKEYLHKYSTYTYTISTCINLTEMANTSHQRWHTLFLSVIKKIISLTEITAHTYTISTCINLTEITPYIQVDKPKPEVPLRAHLFVYVYIHT